MILVVFGFSYWSSHNNKKTQQAATETTAQSSQTATVAKQTALPADTNALFAAALSASDSVASPIVLKNDKLEVTISPKGGQVSRVVLKDFKSYADYKAGKDQALVLYSSMMLRSISTLIRRLKASLRQIFISLPRKRLLAPCLWS